MKIKAEKSFSLADQLFNRESVAKLSGSLAETWGEFNRAKFNRAVLRRFPKLELKERINCMVDALEVQLPDDFNLAVGLLEAALPEPLDPEKTDDDFGEYIWAVPGEYVARHGCTEARLERSLDFLGEATMRFSAESPIRPFLKQFPEQTAAAMQGWTRHWNYHVRRLVSEGTRPYLPWAQRVILPPEEILQLLTQLHVDRTRYVTRSVANNLNDLSRDHPDLVMKTLLEWRDQGRQKSKELAWMTRHALRTLMRTGHPGAYELLGYPANPAFSLTSIRVSPEVKVGKQFKWRGLLNSKANQTLKITLRIHFLRGDGTHATRQYTVCDQVMKRGEKLELEKHLTLKAMTTRTLYPGTHYVDLVVNGVARGKRPFELLG